MSNYIIKQGQVVYVEGTKRDEMEIKDSSYIHLSDEADGMRIKVRLTEDKNKKTKLPLTIDELPWCFPLLPKTFQSPPKIGECVFIISPDAGNFHSDRYYIGPVISQPQFHSNAQFDYGNGSATSLLQNGNQSQILGKISKFKVTKGAFPNKEDVAIIGRDSEDVILKNGELDLRCGIRGEAFNDDKDLKGKVIFNSLNPTYIQMKFKNNLINSKNHQANSIINLVSDKINLISHKDLGLTDNVDLIKEEDLPKIMDKLHVLPYGDVLSEYLLWIVEAIKNHGHNFGPAEPPIRGAYINLLDRINLDELCSKDIRIS